MSDENFKQRQLEIAEKIVALYAKDIPELKTKGRLIDVYKVESEPFHYRIIFENHYWVGVTGTFASHIEKGRISSYTSSPSTFTWE